MQKIMFNDKLDLTNAVLRGRKTQTRRLEDLDPLFQTYIDCQGFEILFENGKFILYNEDKFTIAVQKPRYQIGEVVAVAQSYSDILDKLPDVGDNYTYHGCKSGFINAINYHYKHTHYSQLAGMTNKMFVKADLMPNQIKITNIRMQRLQDITDEECLEEGIIEHPYGSGYMVDGITYDKKCGDYYGSLLIFNTSREAFSALIDKTTIRGTWEKNPLVITYDFELINK